jgi:hypothetical protein
MATLADVRRIALALPGAEEGAGHSPFAISVSRKGKAKGFVWVWMERVDPKKPRVPQPNVLAARVPTLLDKEALIARNPETFFTEPHYEGFPAVLVRLPAIRMRDLRAIIAQAWRCLASPDHLLLAKEPRRKARARSRADR